MRRPGADGTLGAMHDALLRAWHGGDARGALARHGDLLAEDPRDSLALHVAHALDFRLGNRERPASNAQRADAASR
jgi:hypothetical protein